MCVCLLPSYALLRLHLTVMVKESSSVGAEQNLQFVATVTLPHRSLVTYFIAQLGRAGFLTANIFKSVRFGCCLEVRDDNVYLPTPPKVESESLVHRRRYLLVSSFDERRDCASPALHDENKSHQSLLGLEKLRCK